MWLLDCSEQVSNLAWPPNDIYFNWRSPVSTGISRCIYCGILYGLRYSIVPLWLLDCPGQVSDLAWALDNLYFNFSLSASIGQSFISGCIYSGILHGLRYSTALQWLLDCPGQVSELALAPDHFNFNSGLSVSTGWSFVSRCIYSGIHHSLRYSAALPVITELPRINFQPSLTSKWYIYQLWFVCEQIPVFTLAPSMIWGNLQSHYNYWIAQDEFPTFPDLQIIYISIVDC